MDSFIEKEKRAQVLVQALPYIQKYWNRVVVIKYGGHAMMNEELKRQGYGQKVDSILRQLQEDPYSPPYEKLCGEYKGFYSRRVNRTDRIVYEIREGACEDGTDAVVVSRMRTHYRGMFSILML